ncbi:MAG: helix-turn-helix transcriptional regulator [Clostridia bacterium]|nr:helix-turn-helix transcriptional regulator [Clostridia bacterium]
MTYLEGFQNCLNYINEHIEEDYDFDRQYEMANMSKSNFQRFFLFMFDMSLQDYIRKMKLRSAAQMLVNTDSRIADIALHYGYDNQSSFSRACKSEFGRTPGEIRSGSAYTSISPLNMKETMREGCLKMNSKTLVHVIEIKNSHVISFDVDCFDAEDAAWNQMRDWANKHLKDRSARQYIGLAPNGHHPQGQHENASEHVKHAYRAMMMLLEEEAQPDVLYGKQVEAGPDGLYLVNDVALNQYDENGFLDMALCMIKASEAFVEFVKKTDIYDFDYEKGIFYEEHTFDDAWFKNGGLPATFRMWAPIIRK